MPEISQQAATPDLPSPKWEVGRLALRRRSLVSQARVRLTVKLVLLVIVVVVVSGVPSLPFSGTAMR